MTVRTWDSLLQAKFYKIRLREYTPFGTNLYQKLPILAILGAVSPHFKSDNGEILHEGGGLGVPPHAKFCIKKFLKGTYPLGEI